MNSSPSTATVPPVGSLASHIVALAEDATLAAHPAWQALLDHARQYAAHKVETSWSAPGYRHATLRIDDKEIEFSPDQVRDTYLFFGEVLGLAWAYHDPLDLKPTEQQVPPAFLTPEISHWQHVRVRSHTPDQAYLEAPTAPGFYWWRQDSGDRWVPLEVAADPHRNGALFVNSDDQHHYQCADATDPAQAWHGEWHPIRLTPPRSAY